MESVGAAVGATVIKVKWGTSRLSNRRQHIAEQGAIRESEAEFHVLDHINAIFGSFVMLYTFESSRFRGQVFVLRALLLSLTRARRGALQLCISRWSQDTR